MVNQCNICNIYLSVKVQISVPRRLSKCSRYLAEIRLVNLLVTSDIPQCKSAALCTDTKFRHVFVDRKFLRGEAAVSVPLKTHPIFEISGQIEKLQKIKSDLVISSKRNILWIM